MKDAPYIGITGFTSRNEVEQILEDLVLPPGYKLMVGVLASSNFLTSNQDVLARRPKRYPDWEIIPKIFVEHHKCLNFVHLHVGQPCKKGTLHTDIHDMVFRVRMMLEGYPINGIQLNTQLPDVYDMVLFRDTYPNLKFVIQLNNSVLSKYKARKNNSKNIAKSEHALAIRLREYIDVANYLLIDRSGGEGKLLNTDEITRQLMTFETANLFKYFRIVIAGGLSAHSLPNLETLYRMNKPLRLSFDAEKSLISKHTGRLDIANCKEYLSTATKLILKWKRMGNPFLGH